MQKKVERIINFKSLFKYICQKKMKLVVCLLIGCIFGAMYYWTAPQKTQTIQNENVAAVQEAKSKLTKTQIEQADEVYKKYTQLRSNLNSIKTSSVVYNLTEDNSVGEKKVYYISSNSKASTIYAAFSSLLVDDNLCNEVNKLAKTKLSSDNINSLIRVEKENKNEGSEKSNNYYDSGSNKLLIIRIYATNNKLLSVLDKCVTNRVNTLTKSFQKSFGSFQIHLVNTARVKITENEIEELKTSVASNISTISSALNNLTSVLSTNQKMYFDAVVSAENVSTKSVQVKEARTLKGTIKYVVAGGVLLLVLYILLLILLYLVDDRLHYAREVENLYDIPLISTVTDRTNLQQVFMEVKYDLHDDIQNIGVISTIDSEEGNKVKEGLSTELGVLSLKKYPDTDNDFKALKNIKKLIFIEKIGESNVKDIKNVIDYYDNKGIKVDGFVVIDE